MERFLARHFGRPKPKSSPRTIFFGLDSEIRKEVTLQIENNETNAKQERKNGEFTERYGNGRWSIYGRGLHDYMNTFSSVCGLPDLYRFLRDRKESGKGVYALDFMGEGSAIRDLEGVISGGAFVTLGDHRPNWKIVHDRKLGIHPIIGDIFLRDTWHSINEVARTFGGFDLIFCRPEGGLHTCLESIQPHMLIFEKLFQQLKDDGGMLLSQIPDAVAEKVSITKWILEMAHSYPDIEVICGESRKVDRCAKYVFRLVKNNSPKRIISVEQRADTQLAFA